MPGVFADATFQDLWQPEIIVVSILAQIIYLILCHGPLARRLFGQSHMTTRGQTIAYLAGCWLMYFSFAGPLDYLSDEYLFTAHMVQHMIEITLMAPLILKGLPERAYLWLWNSNATRWLIRVWAYPIVAGGVFNVVVTLFHFPFLYELALDNENFHLFEHAVFFIVAGFMYAPLVVRLPNVRELTNGQKLLYLLYNYNLMMPIVVLLLIAHKPWYVHYVDAPRLFTWLTPLGDMQLGAVTMMIFMAGSFITFGVRAYMKQDESIWYS